MITTKTAQIEASASPLYQVAVFDDDVEVGSYQVATNDQDAEKIAVDIYKQQIGLLPPIAVKPPTPACTPRQIRQVLTAVGLRAAVEAAVAAGSQDLRDWWEFSTIIERTHPEVIAMGAALGQTPEQLDALFTAGAAL